MPNKQIDDSTGGSMDSRPNKNVGDMIAQAEARLKRRKLDDLHEKQQGKGGLGVELHPLLRKVKQEIVIPKNHNPLKQNVRKWFDPTALNPYLNQQDLLVQGNPQRKPKGLQFNRRGKYISEGDKLREKIRQREIEDELFKQTQAKGLIADEQLGEPAYKLDYPPTIEWWDKPFVKDNNYDNIGDDDENSKLILDGDSNVLTSYIYHPKFIEPLWEKPQQTNQLYLTKREMKRKRRNERQEKLKIKQDRIKLGLDEPPPPKVKLSNLMSVLTNEAIKDPTAVEQKVRQEVEERLQTHLQANEARKLTKEQRHEKIHQKNLKQLDKGLFTCIFRIDKLVNPQHLYKVDINAKQLELMGICLINEQFSMVVVEGSFKNIQFYKKLLLKRINWHENTIPKNAPDDFQLLDLSKNRCRLVWEGELNQSKFKKWSIMRTRNEDDVFDILNEFKIENYWRQAQVNEEV